MIFLKHVQFMAMLILKRDDVVASHGEGHSSIQYFFQFSFLALFLLWAFLHYTT